MIHLGTQYYRPPFPNERYWEDDIKRMADSGLNTLQLWVVWAWVEAKPGEFRFDDYDRLVALANKHDLEVVLSTIAAIQPYWIHRVVPGSRMVDNFGHEVVSSNRGECHYGLTPGGCIDHPGVWERMRQFLAATAEHYYRAPNLFGWDAWNELRWNVQADGLVCYCDYTLNRFRAWLDAKYGGLDGLNRAWRRRYSSWDDVRPGKMPSRPYTEMMAFEDFISWRAVQHAYDRYEVLKTIDPQHPVTVHGAQPTVLHGSDAYPNATALHRGNDWYFADRVDGVGTSSFPKWGGLEMDRAEFINRIDFVASARQGKRIWLSELQGGRSNIGFDVAQSVDAASQQSWVWTGLSAGADAILFWCWRDEVFGRESTGFGLAGADGLAEERLAAMRKTGEILQAHDDLLTGYEPAPADVGIFFSPQSYYLYWAQDATARRGLTGIQGYAQAMVRRNIPYRIIEEAHLDELQGLKLLILPRTVVMDAPVAEALTDFVRRGGTLVCESEVGAFGTDGLYRYPEDRFFAELTGIQEIGRRRLPADTIPLSLGERTYRVLAAQWLTPMFERGSAEREEALLKQVALDKGRMLFVGSYLGDAYLAARGEKARAFEDFLLALAAAAGVTRPVTVLSPLAAGNEFVHVRVGAAPSADGSNGVRPVAFVFAPTPDTEVELRFEPGFFAGPVRDLLTSERVATQPDTGGLRVTLGPTEWGVSVLVG
ncbi:MAG: beta-galactosidase [Anaerolineae bacterium]